MVLIEAIVVVEASVLVVGAEVSSGVWRLASGALASGVWRLFFWRLASGVWRLRGSRAGIT